MSFFLYKYRALNTDLLNYIYVSLYIFCKANSIIEQRPDTDIYICTCNRPNALSAVPRRQI